MDFILTLLMYIVVGAVVLMSGMLISRDPGRSLQSVVPESLAWGAGFVVALSAQVVAIATMH